MERLLASRHRCHSVLVQQEHHRELVRRAEHCDPELQILSVPGALIRDIVGFDFHRGVLACGIQEPFGSAEQFIQTAKSEKTPAHILVLCGLNIPENIGSLLRTAAAFGIRHIWITPDVLHPYSRRVLRVSMATALKMYFYVTSNLPRDLVSLADQLGYRTVATTLSPDSVGLGAYRSDQRPLAILVGSEASGLPADVESVCRDRLTIPMSSGVDSLNANVATAIVLYELLGKRVN